MLALGASMLFLVFSCKYKICVVNMSTLCQHRRMIIFLASESSKYSSQSSVRSERDERKQIVQFWNYIKMFWRRAQTHASREDQTLVGIQRHFQHNYATFFIGMEPFGVFKSSCRPSWVIQGFVLFQVDWNIIFSYLIMLKKHRLDYIYRCIPVCITL